MTADLNSYWQKPKRPIVFNCNENYAMPLATAMLSIVDSCRGRWPIEIYLLSNTFRDETIRKVLDSVPEESVVLHRVQVDLSAFEEFSSDLYRSDIIFARLLIPKLFHESVSRVLYLDVDILVLDDLAPLWTLDMEGSVVGAVVDSGIDPLLKSDDARVKNLPRVKRYFNAGVQLIDLPRWRECEISARAINYLKQHPHSRFPDQDAVNVACDGLWKCLPSRWNMQKHDELDLANIANDARPGIVHFVSSSKPWNPRIPNINAEFYDAIRARTCFARSRWEISADRMRSAWSRAKTVLKESSLFRS